MVHVVGWTPTSRGEDPDEVYLSQFANAFAPGEERQQDYPMIRSGHRCFTDNDYFYLIGGYTNEVRRGGVFKELWAMSLATFEWRRYSPVGDFPDTMASFAIVQLSPYSKSFLLFGGSGTMFGSTSSNRLYLMYVNNDECTVSSRILRPLGDVPEPIYGHSMCRGEIPGKYYVVGGTEGMVFNFDVYALTMKNDPDAKSDEDQYTWHFEQVSTNEGLAGRYRFETVYDEENRCLLFLGGGNAGEVFGFDKIPSLNVLTRETSEITTKPDVVHGFPEKRRCHTVVRYKKKLIITGGVGHDAARRHSPVYGDMWSLNLDDFSWKKCGRIPEAVLFHDTVVTEDGWMLSFGGVHGIQQDSPRNNILYGAWLDVPLLQRFAIESIRSSCPEMFSGLYCGNLRPSRVIEIVNLFLKKGRREEKEKNIIEEGKVRFHEDPNRKRRFLNDDGHIHIIRHQQEDEHELERRHRELEEADRQVQRQEDQMGLVQGLGANFNAVHRHFQDALERFMEAANNRLPIMGIPIGEYELNRDSGEETDSEGGTDEDMEENVVDNLEQILENVEDMQENQ